MTIFTKLTSASLCIAMTIIAGCRSEISNSQKFGPLNKNESILQSYRLIDTERQDEAVALLEPLISNEPSDLDLRVAVASALASKAGVRAYDFVPAALKAQELSKATLLPKEFHSKVRTGDSSDLEKPLSTADVKPSTDTTRAKHSIKIIGNFTKIAGLTVEIFDRLPYVENDQLVYIAEALHHLDTLESQLRISDIRYRIILRAVMLKSQLLAFAGRAQSAQSRQFSTCVELVTYMKKDILSSARNLSYLLSDLASVSKASEVDKWQSASLKTAEALGEIATLSDDIASIAFLIDTLDGFYPVKDLKEITGLCQ